MPSIKPHLLKRLRETLLQCDAFESDTGLRAVFIDARLSPWRNDVPAASTPSERVDALLTKLRDRRNENGEHALVLLLRVLSERVDPGDALHRELAELAKDLKHDFNTTDNALLVACQTQVNGMLDHERQKYKQDLYVHRALERDLNDFFDKPLDDPLRNCFLIVAPAGSGKTNLLCELARERVAQQPVMLLLGRAMFSLDPDTGLRGVIRRELTEIKPNLIDRAETCLNALHHQAEVLDCDALIFLDAINEYHEPTSMRRALEDLLLKARGRRIKLIITCRDYYWGLFQAPFWRSATVNPLPPVGEDEDAETDSFFLFAPEEHEQALDLYLARYKITGRPTGRAAEQCRHPLLLLFFCEAFQGQSIVGQAEQDIRHVELFRLYWERKLRSIADMMSHYGNARRQKDLVMALEHYLLNIASYMLRHNVRAIPRNEFADATEYTEDYGDPHSMYGQIRDEFIILEEKEQRQLRHRTLHVAFVYEEFMEYVMARALMRDWEELDEVAILAEVTKLREKYKDFAQILGVMVYLALMLKEDRDIALWSLLLDSGEQWQQVVFEAFRKLPEKELKDVRFSETLLEILNEGNVEITKATLELLKLERVGNCVQESVMRTVCELADHKELSISRRTLLALGNMKTYKENIIPVLIRAWRSGKAVMQYNAVTAFGKLGDEGIEVFIEALGDRSVEARVRAKEALERFGGTRTTEALITALGNENILVRRGAVELLGQFRDIRAVEPLISALGDEDTQVRWDAVTALGRFEDARTVERSITALGDKNILVRWGAIELLGQLGEMRMSVVESLIAALGDEDAQVRKGAIAALGRYGNIEAVKLVIIALNDADARVRRGAVELLGQFRDIRAVEPLISALGDEDTQVRKVAAEALGRLGNTQIEELLITTLRDGDEELRQQIGQTLRRSMKPSLALLKPTHNVILDQRDAQRRGSIIENTLKQFNIPVSVTKTRIGPAVTEFSVSSEYTFGNDGEPRTEATRVRVSQIISLTDDLALALAAKSIRIHAPVTGYSIVSIEVPNTNVALITLRDVLASETLAKCGKPLCFAIGVGVGGSAIVADLAKMPHLLIAGTTGSGKSVFIKALATSLVMHNAPKDLRLIAIAPKVLELSYLNGLPHLLGKVETDLVKSIRALRWIQHEMDRRYKLFSATMSRNLDNHNRKMTTRDNEGKLPRIVVLIDDLADLMMSLPEETERILTRIAMMARATGIHLVVATQLPRTDVVTGLIKANFPARVSFATTSSVDSRVIIDTPGAESLLGRGDMLFLPPDALAPKRVQGCFVSEDEISAIVRFWRRSAEMPPEKAPWEVMAESKGPDMMRIEGQAVDAGLLERAIALIQKSSSISTSSLQRRLRISYPRAVLLMEEMERMGLVGPRESSGHKRRIILGGDDDR